MKSTKFPFWLIVFFGLSCPLSIFPDPIITRHDIDDSKYVQLAKKYPVTNCLFYFNKTDMVGTHIEQNWILSAAHVAADLSVGDFILAQNGKYQITRIHIHPEWNNNQAYDLALIKVDLGKDYIPIVSIYEGRDEKNQIVLVAGNGDKGNGLTGPDGNDGKLRAATNRVEEVTAHWLKWQFDNPETDSVNATEMEGISGPGDSSGPAFIFIQSKGYLAGISSGQSTRATKGREGVYGVREYYVRVSSHVDWIKTILAQN